ncbi:MAG: divalent-cation tolerance protein CutA [Bdellovibrionaceae bacterium]|nr:divalent-cation tolerance protein CutA [Pseudobdellovibrionaceae bacterium]
MSLAVYYAVFPDGPTAENICRQLVEEKLIGCANIFAPHTAIYPWDGKIETSKEVPAFLKTESDLHQRLEARYLALHPYEVPCLLRLQVDAINPGYADWLRSLLQKN